MGISKCFTLLTPPDITLMIFLPVDITIIEFILNQKGLHFLNSIFLVFSKFQEIDGD